MRDTYLLQELKNPPPQKEGVKPHHVFGGGNMALSQDAWNILDSVCTVSPMYAAEYEFGALPKTLSKFVSLSSANQLSSFVLTFSPTERKLNMMREFVSKHKRTTIPFPKYCHVFGIAPSAILEEVKARVVSLIGDKDRNIIKNGTPLYLSFDPIDDRDLGDPNVGWIDIENHFMFFASEKMWRGFCEMFSITPEAVPPLPSFSIEKLKKPVLVKLAVDLGYCRTKSVASRMKKDELKTFLSEKMVHV